MTKLRHLKAEAFRGARFELPVDFTKDHRSIAIFGENAGGKSTITDALEWFIHDRVEHLWKEDCKEDALRHVLAKDSESTVEVRFDGKDREGKKVLPPNRNTSKKHVNESTRTLVSTLQEDRLILRHSDIAQFIEKTKGQKREAIAEIIGYEEITQFRMAIQQTLNALRKEGAYTGAKQQAEKLQSAMVEAVGQVVADRAAFLEMAKTILAPFELKTTISDDASYEKALEELRSYGSSAEKIKASQRLAQLETACNDLRTDIDKLLRETERFQEQYNALVKERDNVNKLRLSDFLVKGKAVIDSHVITDDQCPFCLSPYPLTQLEGEVAQRLEAMAELQKKLDETKVLKDTLLDTVANTAHKAKEIYNHYSDLDDFSKLISSARAMLQALRDFYKGVGSAFNAIEVFEAPEGFDAALSDLRRQCETASTQARQAAKNLNLTELEKRVSDALTKLQTLGDHVQDYETCQDTIEAYEAQILTLSTMFDRFIEVQNSALQAVLDTISGDVGALYSKLHPKESIDNVHLSMVGEEGVEFEYSFHGQQTQPPRKYLSESHLNSLGIILFLVNARIFNQTAKFMVLDDIVTSFDTRHRRRLLRLLREEFSDWQIIILTHENVWFDLIKKEMAQSGWLFREVHSDDENGILVDNSPATLKALIERKRGKADVTNDLRKLLEAILKDICYALEVKVSFRFNEFNEKRMSDELLARLRSTLKEKSPDLVKHEVFTNLAGSTLIANLDSHDNPEKIVGEDIDVLLEDIEKLASLFICADCNRPIRADTKVPGAKEISCKCGKGRIPWKS